MEAPMSEQEPFHDPESTGRPQASTIATSAARLADVSLVAMGRMSATRANTRASLIADRTLPFVLVYAGLRYGNVQALPALLTLFSGLLLFTAVEYVFHRWVFHGSGSLKEFREGHGRHHEDPLGDDALPFFLPPAILLILAGLFCLAMPGGYALLMAGAIAFGYAAYGLGHNVIHSVRFRHPIGRSWAARHHIHHHHPDRNFGVTTPLWDIVLGTRYVSKRDRKD
jgi:sterol desaturase/sphingolipid hydroxylase (fatty acid hydroxylase superfamily)